MDCGSFLEGYSDFRDDLLPLPERVRFAAHLRACEACARYDRVVDSGVQVYASGEELSVSDDFMDRLQHRLYHVDDEMAAARRRRARPRVGRRAAAGLAAAAAGAVLAPQLYTRTAPTVTMLPPVAASAPAAPAAFASADGEASLAARLEEVGVQVLPLPYRQVVHRSASRLALASYAVAE